ncbi:MAG: hypothetical protein CL609_19760 [Anaerolineaceae bacterium]|nr:hypothetical protein [Anaerolineaceae bacterium]
MKTNIIEFLSITKTWGCEKCGSLYLKHDKSSFCPVCGDKHVQEINTNTQYPEIELILNFHKNVQDYEDKIQNFIQPVKFKTEQLNLNTIKKNGEWVFFPFWLVDSKANGSWKAEFGFNYLVESSVEHLQHGEWISQKTNETRIDWKPRQGTVEKEYSNISISALSYYNQLERIFGSYNLSNDNKSLTDYQFTNQITLIYPNIDKNTGWQFAKESLIKKINSDCQSAAGAQHTKTFSQQVQFSDQNWTLLLLPYFVSHYSDEAGNPYSIWINGQSLRIQGDRYSSPAKGKQFGFVFLLISFVLFLLFLLFGYLSRMSDLVAILAFFSLLASIGFLIGSIYSFFYPSNWNKKNTNTFNKAG